LDYHNPIIVLGEELSALHIIRTFERRNIDVHCIITKKSPIIFSKYLKKYYINTKVKNDIDALKKILNKISKKFSKRAVVYPTSDLDALNLSMIKEQVKDDFYIIAGNKEIVEILVNKSKFYEVISKNNLNYPDTYTPKNVEHVKRLGSKIEYPVFIKPIITQLFNEAFPGALKGFVANTKYELIHYYKLVKNKGVDVIIQKIIQGPPTNSYQLEGYYDKNFLPKVLFARQRIRIWPPDFGNTSLCVSIPIKKLSKEKSAINKFIKKIGYSGLMSAEYKKDEKDGKLKLLEINARVWWHIWLSQKCGADIVYLSYLDAIGEKVNYNEEYETNIKSLYLIQDILSSINMIKNKKINFKDWLSSYTGPIQFSYFSIGDLNPFLLDSANKTYSYFNKLIKYKL
jgi:predicted ATP-grasp superfamily ATP-dependent carboligase